MVGKIPWVSSARNTHVIRRGFALTALTLLCLSGGTAAQRSGTPAPLVAFVDATVIPMNQPGTLVGYTVVVENGVITRVGPTSDVTVPQETHVVDATGKFLIPGLADMHAHLYSFEQVDLMVAHGITLVREMSGQSWHLWVRNMTSAGFRTGPRIVSSGPILEGTPPPETADVIVTEGKVLVDDSASAAAAVREQLEEGYDFIKVYNNLPAEAYYGIVAEARAHNKPVAGHIPFAIGLEGAIAAGQKSIEHLRGYIWHSVPENAPDQPATDFRSRLVSWRHTDTTTFAALAERTAQAGIWNTPTLIVHQNHLPADRIHELTDRPGWNSCTRELWRDPLATRRRSQLYSHMTDDDFRATMEGQTKRQALVRALRDAGAGLLAGTDARPRGYALHWELEQLVLAGLTPWEALATATINPARFFDEQGQSGTVAEGSRGDLVLLDADPLTDIRNSSSISTVLVGDRILIREQLDELIDRACETIRGSE